VACNSRSGRFGAIGVFGTSWLLAGGPFTIIAFLVYWRFFLHLPLATRVLFLVAGSLYIAGAIGFEAVSGRYLVRYVRARRSRIRYWGY
jgi:hypothetical protein